eukprot:TRINITY_DN2760_c0_g1_i7.p1 TRINITY_DN2760_c0_g1~~TRINITY_DN2760_c0_g1_i7.p1  ORF type:complete len:105 (-),score=7.56 TRINITY_DN2760_c0_g1_i7:322-636(-)
MIRRPPRSTQSRSSAASDVYKRQFVYWVRILGFRISHSQFPVLSPESLNLSLNLVFLSVFSQPVSLIVDPAGLSQLDGLQLTIVVLQYTGAKTDPLMLLTKFPR